VVHARPECVAELEHALAAFAGVEVAAADRSGKLVITIEADDERSIARQLDAIGVLPGVLSTTIVAHHAEPAEAEEGASP
jgi:nitrate reductase NapD